MHDAVDQVLDQWKRERPDIDTAPLAAVARIMRLSRLIDREIKVFLARHGLEPGEFDVLSTLRRSGREEGLTAGGLTAASLVTGGAITNRIARMEAKALVERVIDPGDRRLVHIRLLPAGRQLIDQVYGEHIANYARLLQPLDVEEADALAQTLRTLLAEHGDTG